MDKNKLKDYIQKSKLYFQTYKKTILVFGSIVIVSIFCIILILPLFFQSQEHIYAGTQQYLGTSTTTSSPEASIEGKTNAKYIEQTILTNIAQNGWDSNSSINKGLGGLWVNWEYGTNPLQVNFNGTGKTDVQTGATLRHDPLTDLRYLHNLWLYKTQNKNNTQYDSQITKYTAIVKAEWVNAHDPQRGWLYDEEFSDLYRLSKDQFYKQQMLNLATNYAKSINKVAGIYIKTSSTHPLGYYRPADALETGLALIQAGTTFKNPAWITIGENEVNFVYQHAYISHYHTFPGEMDTVLTTAKTVNSNETFYIDKYRNYTIYGNEVTPSDIGQIVISLVNTYTVTKDDSYLQKAFDLLTPFTAATNSLKLWDQKNLGYFEGVEFTGSTLTNLGSIKVLNGKKDPGRMMEMLWAYYLADQNGGKFQDMESSLLNIALQKAYYASGHGVLFEVRPDWSLVLIGGIPENWVTTEAMGIELEALFAASPAVNMISIGANSSPMPQTTIQEMPSGHDYIQGTVASVTAKTFIINAQGRYITVDPIPIKNITDKNNSVIPLNDVSAGDLVKLSGAFNKETQTVTQINYVRDENIPK